MTHSGWKGKGRLPHSSLVQVLVRTVNLVGGSPWRSQYQNSSLLEPTSTSVLPEHLRRSCGNCAAAGTSSGRAGPPSEQYPVPALTVSIRSSQRSVLHVLALCSGSLPARLSTANRLPRHRRGSAARVGGSRRYCTRPGQLPRTAPGRRLHARTYRMGYPFYSQPSTLKTSSWTSAICSRSGAGLTTSWRWPLRTQRSVSTSRPCSTLASSNLKRLRASAARRRHNGN